MRVPVAWLTDYCDSGLSTEDLAERLALTGTEVERVEHVGVPVENGNLGLIQVGRVVAVREHPNADRLRVCEVDLGEGHTRTIVCGADNVVEQANVAVALPGAELAGGVKIKRAKLRDVESDGMILSAEEVGLGQGSEGIMILPDGLEVGEELGNFAPIATDVLELEITPNRPDCLSVYGVAREVHAATGAELAPDPTIEEAPAQGSESIDDLASVVVEDPDLCPRFTARCFVDVKVGESPLWLKARLAAAGQRPINNVVDITNYVMLAVGQPLHAYDLDEVPQGKLVVRRAREGETLVTLDGERRAFDSDVVLVCDANGPSGIGGVMGGGASEVKRATSRVLLEAANWNGANILRTSNRLALRSEASNRFEKQLHPALAMAAQRLASRLMVELCEAKLVPGTIDVFDGQPEPKRIQFRPARIEVLLGERIEVAEVEAILGRLGFDCEKADEALDVEVPDFRYYDVRREADLIEEIARIHGLDRLPTTLPALQGAVGGLTGQQCLRRRAEDALRDRGLDEAICWSFVAPDFVDRLRLPDGDQRRRVLGLTNPLSADQAAMRTTLLPGLLDAVRHNAAAHAERIALFESGRVFFSNGQEALPDEHHHLAALLSGDFTPQTWRSSNRQADFHVAKSILVSLLEDLRVPWRLAEGGPAFLHPGKAAEVLCGAHEAGWIGEINPLVARAWGIDGRSPVGFELNLDVVLAQVPESTTYEDVITFPAVYQDIAVVIDEEVEAQAVVEIARAGGGSSLRAVQLFDLYRGEQIGEGKKSLALRLEFRSPEGTLTEENVNESRAAIAAELSKELGATLRE